MTLVLRSEFEIPRGSDGYPAALALLGDLAPHALSGCGSPAALRQPLVAIFSSVAVPGDGILAAYDIARALRDAGIPTIGGFQSPVERGCLDFLLRGRQGVVICPARGIEGMRAAPAWRQPLEERRLLFLSPFPGTQRRASAATADTRNRVVAALADRIILIHAVPGGRRHRLATEALAWKKRVLCPDLPVNRDLVVMGAEPVNPSALPL